MDLETKEIVSLVGIFATFLVSFVTFLYNAWNNRRSAYLSQITGYRLKWIDMVRGVIGKYLLSLDMMIHCKPDTKETCCSEYIKMHYEMLSYLTTFSPKDKEAEKTMCVIKECVESAVGRDFKPIEREQLQKLLSEVDPKLRALMDQNWFKMKREILGFQEEQADDKDSNGR